MIREVDLTSYLPEFMKTYREPVAALQAMDPEFVLLWNGADKVLYNRFLSTADENGLNRYEEMMGIYSSEEDTLESRRLRIQTKWFNSTPYTMRVLIQRLEAICGTGNFEISGNFEIGYTLRIDTNFEGYGGVEQLEYLINSIVPANIVMEAYNHINCPANGSLGLGGGCCTFEEYTVTTDFKETYSVRGDMLLGAGVIITETITATSDGV